MEELRNPDELKYLLVFLQSAAVGLLIGLERERHRFSRAGLRTFTLIALAGTLFAFLDEQLGAHWNSAVGLLIVGGMLIAAYARPVPSRRRSENAEETAVQDNDPGTTTIAAALATYGLGALLWLGHTVLVAALALAVTSLLYFRSELHGATRRISHLDLVSFLQFAVLAFVLLPVLPDENIGPYGALNPFRMGLLVVLITGVSLAGYVALRIFGERKGVLLVGFLGGLASSTATTLVYSRHARANVKAAPLAMLAILAANQALLLRMTVLAAVVSPRVLVVLLPALAINFVSGSLYVAFRARSREITDGMPQLEVRNPVELRTAIVFTVLFAAISIAVSWINEEFGTAGVFGVAALSGLVDLDAISLSVQRLANSGDMTVVAAAITIGIAYCANLVFKFGVAVTLGTPRLALPLAGGFLAAGVGMLWLFLF